MRMDDRVLHVLRTHSFAGSPAMEMVIPSTLTTMDGCTGSISRSQMEDTPTQIYGQIYPNTPHPSCIPLQPFKIKMANRCFYFLRATKRRSRATSIGWRCTVSMVRSCNDSLVNATSRRATPQLGISEMRSAIESERLLKQKEGSLPSCAHNC